MNFQRLWENIKNNHRYGEEVDDQEIDDQSISAIKTGIGINDTFWDDFIQLLNNSEGLSSLLDISINDITSWRKKIESALKKVQLEDGEVETKKNKKLIKTGQTDGD
jgi:hypothetical protein